MPRYLPSAAGARSLWLCALLVCASGLPGRAATLSSPTVDAYNVRVGTQTFNGLYHFTTNTLLVETAQAIRSMGSETLKMELAEGFAGQYGITLGPQITNLVTLARDEPSCRQVFDMNFRHYVLWTYAFSTTVPDWDNGYVSGSDQAKDYREFYDLTRYLLTNYNNSGKTFYLGHWEGDGYLTRGNFATNPTPAMVQGFINYLNNRQKAIDDAKQATSFTNVNVFGYAEANRVRDAMNNNPGSNIRMINAVIPYVTNLDYVSYSSYDMQRLDDASKTATLDYMEAHLPTNKARLIPGERIWIGEYGYANAGDTPAQQEPETRAYIRFLLNYGRRGIPYILFWEIYDNEKNSDGSYKYFYLIDPAGNQAPCYELHQRYINNARLLTAQFLETNGRLPDDAEFVAMVTPMLNAPLSAPVPLAVRNLEATVVSPGKATLSGTLAQGVYGDDGASVWVFYGRNDGGTVRSAWESSQWLGVNTNFNPTPFTAQVSGLSTNTEYFYRFYATNSSGESWAPTTAQLINQTLNPDAYTCRMRITFPGYNRESTLTNFPAQVNLSAGLPGFSYRQFASPTGADLRFTDAGGYRLIPHEIDEWNTDGVSTVWVRVPKLSNTNTLIWAYWGNPAAAEPAAYSTNGTVWSADNYLVYHLKERTFPYLDSTGAAHAVSGVPPVLGPGVIGHACEFDGATEYLNCGLSNLGNGFTLSAWVNVASDATNIQTIWANKPAGWNSDGFALYINSYNTRDQELRLETGDGLNGMTAATAAGALGFGSWHLVTAVVDRTAGSARLYIDGLDRTQTPGIQADFSNQGLIDLGRFPSGSFYFKGALDEVRIENTTRSPDWVWAEWMTSVANGGVSSYSVVNPQPPLDVKASSGGLVLGWPASAGAFTLYTATNLTAPVVWTPAAVSAVLTNGQWQAKLPTDDSGNRFFRLQQ